jgi:hypothetical protein
VSAHARTALTVTLAAPVVAMGVDARAEALFVLPLPVVVAATEAPIALALLTTITLTEALRAALTRTLTPLALTHARTARLRAVVPLLHRTVHAHVAIRGRVTDDEADRPRDEDHSHGHHAADYFEDGARVVGARFLPAWLIGWINRHGLLVGQLERLGRHVVCRCRKLRLVRVRGVLVGHLYSSSPWMTPLCRVKIKPT